MSTLFLVAVLVGVSANVDAEPVAIVAHRGLAEGVPANRIAALRHSIVAAGAQGLVTNRPDLISVP